MTRPKTLYKVLVDGKSCHGGTLEWPLPERGEPGEWVEVSGEVKICKRGIHLTTSPFSWYKRGCRVYEAEMPEVQAWEGDKCVGSTARLIREVPFPAPWLRVEAFLATISNVPWFKPDGKPDPEWKLFPAAAGAAARNAAGAAARNSAWDAARNAADAAAWDAAGHTTRNAAGAAAWDAARAAAWDAARAAAWDAAGHTAWNAVGDAVGNAAGDAVWNAARAAALMARIELVRDTALDPKHIAHAEARWRVWQKGYGLLCDVSGVLYVYGRVA